MRLGNLIGETAFARMKIILSLFKGIGIVVLPFFTSCAFNSLTAQSHFAVESSFVNALQRTGNGFHAFNDSESVKSIINNQASNHQFETNASFAPIIICPVAQTVCANNGSNFVQTGSSWDASAFPTGACPGTVTISYTSSVGVSP